MTAKQSRTQETRESIDRELECMKRKTGLGHRVRAVLIPGAERWHRGRLLREQVRGDTIEIYVEQKDEALELVRHGFIEWILGQHSKPWRRLVNKIIEAYEEQQHDQKEPIADALAKLLEEEVSEL